MMLTSLCRR